ncbi:MAG TPA: hypothetical protein VLX68_02460 [Chitinivibrionales bacterium]|nr:hypothetical protein [Chitinivibrionales bacterium]
MMKGSLVQIHYHNRPGGVASVMGHYSDAFIRECKGVPCKSIIVCAQEKMSDDAKGPRVIDARECGYRSFASRRAFCKASDKLFDILGKIIASTNLPHPVRVVGHNLNLGKNCALSSAFARLAAAHSSSGGEYRFFSVAHDFAEEGRMDLMAQIEKLERMGIKIWHDLYPARCGVCFIALNKRYYSLLKKAGFLGRLVPNPVIAPAAVRRISVCSRKKIISGLVNCARKDRAAFDPESPLLIYPSRVISRKNLVEAILLSRFFFSASLLLGESGTSIADRALASCLKKLCAKYKIPVIFEAGRAIRSLDHQETPYSLLTKASDACISTSVLEGFGYALYEPWLYKKPVIGRVPAGSDVQKKIRAPWLYNRLFIPLGWINVNKIIRKYFDGMMNCGDHSDFKSFLFRFKKAFINGQGIDFASLDLATQCAILERLCRRPELIDEWKTAFPRQTRSLVDPWNAVMKRQPAYSIRNKKLVIAEFGEKAFATRFCKCFEKPIPSVKRGRPDTALLRRMLCSLDTFRLLTTPHFP